MEVSLKFPDGHAITKRTKTQTERPQRGERTKALNKQETLFRRMRKRGGDYATVRAQVCEARPKQNARGPGTFLQRTRRASEGAPNY